MPFLGRSSPSSLSDQNIDHNRIEMATTELDMISDVFNRLASACYAKCIGPRFPEGELNKGESVCVDHCVSKFFLVNKKVGEKMHQIGASTQGGPAGTSQLPL